MDFRFILFTHFPGNANSVSWTEFGRCYGKVLSVLRNPNNPGMLVIFNECGWLPLLNTVGANFDIDQFSEEISEKDEVLANFNNLSFKNEEDRSRIRIITASDLNPIVNNIRGDKPGFEATRLQRFLVSEDPKMTYDTAKVVEAIVRLRHVGSGIPILRVDWDALLNDESLDKHLQSALRDTIAAYNAFDSEPLIQSFMLSGGYSSPEYDQDEWTVNDYNTAYATRVFPALIPNQAVLDWLNGRKLATDSGYDDCQLQVSDLEELAELGAFDGGLVSSFYESMAKFGADAKVSVVSGSLLSLSDGSIIDLPPFSNLRRNVMWIDDHLKYLLHQSLGHFRREQLKVGHLDFQPRIYASVFKDRLLAGQGNLRKYTLGSYIPTVFWGAVMDQWIQPERSAKAPVGKVNSYMGSFTRALQKALQRGNFGEDDRTLLRRKLSQEAMTRAEEIRSSWSKLCSSSGEKSFAAYWVSTDPAATTSVMAGIDGELPKTWIGWGLLAEGATEIKELEHLSIEVRSGIDVLVEDALTYIDWALEWPSFVRSVRAVRNGSLRLDSSWEATN